MNNSAGIRNLAIKVSSDHGKKLYKYLLRQSQKLPKGPKEHYQFMIKQVSIILYF